MEKTGVHCTWRETLAEQGENPQQTQPTFGVTARICARVTLVRALLLPIIENKWLSLLNHRSHSIPQRRLRRPATVPKPITFCKVTNKHQTFFFSVKTIARNLGKMYHSLNAGHLQLDESVRLNTLVIRCFFTSPTTVSKLLSPFYKKRGHKKRFSLTTTNSARLKQTKQRQNQGTTLQFFQFPP